MKKQNSEFLVRVLLKHREQPLHEVSALTGIAPEIAHVRGEERFAPNGVKLTGVHDWNVWSTSRVYRETRDLHRAVSDMLTLLTPAKSLLRTLFLEESTEASGSIILGIGGDQDIGDELQPVLLARFQEFGLRLGIEVYPHPRRSGAAGA